MLEFCIRMYYAAGGEIAPLMQRYTVKTLEEMYAKYFGGIDKSRFKPGVEPRQVLDMLIYLTDGYIHQQQMAGRAFDLDDMMRQYFLWRDILRQYATRRSINERNSDRSTGPYQGLRRGAGACLGWILRWNRARVFGFWDPTGQARPPRCAS